MTVNPSQALVRNRLGDALDVETQIAAALAEASPSLSQVGPPMAVERLRASVRAHVTVLAELGQDSGRPALDAVWPAGRDGSSTQAVLSLQRAFVAATQAYEVLFTTARILGDPDVCDLADQHLTDTVASLQILAQMLPDSVARELNLDGLFCQCICPACGIGACLCVRSSISAVAEAWGWPGLPPTAAGVELRSPPRPDSQLAVAGVRAGDRIESVDGAQVGSNSDLQAAVRQHRIGEIATLQITNARGERHSVAVKHVSDWS